MSFDDHSAAAGFTDGVDAAAADPGSLAARMRAKAARLANETEIVALPGWDEEFFVRVRRLSPKEYKDVAKLVGSPRFNAAFVAASTVELVERDAEGNDTALGTWAQVGEKIMGLPTGTNTSDVIATLLPADTLLGTLVDAIGVWAKGLSKSDEDELGK